MNDFERRIMELMRWANALHNYAGAHQYDLVSAVMQEGLLGDPGLTPHQVVMRLRPTLINLEFRGYLELADGCKSTWKPVDLLTQIAMEL